MSFLLLWLLATLDSAFAGCRDAAGRSLLIDKRAYYARAALRGALWGQAAVLAVGAAFGVVYLLSNDPRALLADADAAARRMLLVFVPYSLVILTAFAVRLLPSVDLRSITSTTIFGPLTLLRPVVAAAGVVWAVVASRRASFVPLGLLTLALMLSLESFLGRLRKKRQHDKV